MRRLDGPRVYLRPLGEGDTSDVIRWRSDPDVMRQLFSERAPTREEHSLWLARLPERTDRQEFVIVLRDPDRAVGTVGLSRIDHTAGSAEYGILVGESGWREKGIAREASTLILSYAFGELGLRVVELRLFADNRPARHLYAALGFSEVPELSDRREKGSEVRATIAMVLSAGDWQLHE